jgi:environmental stress-induced protein Ves
VSESIIQLLAVVRGCRLRAMRPRLIQANTYRRERWRNDLGWTREIARGEASRAAGLDSPHIHARIPAGEPAFAWRLSIAEIEHDCAFSLFPGCDRHLVLLSGNGMRLAFDDGECVDVLPPHGRVAFAGERALHCRLLDGPTHDFNVMVRRDRCAAQVLHRPLVGSMVFFAEPGVSWAIHLLAGGARIKQADLVLAPGDTALLEEDPAASSARHILDGAGEALLVRLQRIHPVASPRVPED